MTFLEGIDEYDDEKAKRRFEFRGRTDAEVLALRIRLARLIVRDEEYANRFMTTAYGVHLTKAAHRAQKRVSQAAAPIRRADRELIERGLPRDIVTRIPEWFPQRADFLWREGISDLLKSDPELESLLASIAQFGESLIESLFTIAIVEGTGAVADLVQLIHEAAALDVAGVVRPRRNLQRSKPKKPRTEHEKETRRKQHVRYRERKRSKALGDSIESTPET